MEANGRISKTDWYQYFRLNEFEAQNIFEQHTGQLGLPNGYQEETQVLIWNWNRVLPAKLLQPAGIHPVTSTLGRRSGLPVGSKNRLLAVTHLLFLHCCMAKPYIHNYCIILEPFITEDVGMIL